MIGRPTPHGSPAGLFFVDAEFAEHVASLAWYQHSGYWSSRIQGKTVLLHRFVWELKYGAAPEMLDHINRIRCDCRISNLRPATKSLNGRNMTRRRTKYHGLPRGVWFRPTFRKPYVVEIKIHGRRCALGSYATVEEASAAYEAAAARAISVEEVAARSRFEHG